MPVKLDELLEAYEFVSASGIIEMRAWVCRASGKFFFWDSDTSEPLEEDEFDKDEGEEGEPAEDAESASQTDADDPDKLPADILDEEKYLPIPDKKELDLGSRLPFAFTREFLPRDYDEVRRSFSKRGAYSKFKALLARRNALDQWYDFEQKATEKALREWCEDNTIEIEEPQPTTKKEP
jgi:hypothetical protein